MMDDVNDDVNGTMTITMMDDVNDDMDVSIISTVTMTIMVDMNGHECECHRP